MLNIFYKLIGFFAKVIASIVVLVIVIGSATNYLYNEENSNNGVSKTPNVKFANFKEFKNEQNKVISKKEQKVLQSKFQDEFLTKFALISKNISIYATETKQVVPDVAKLEEGLFMIVSKFDYTNRSSYLTQLLKETNKLVNYSEVVAIDKTKTTIKWVEFLDWFTADFEYQLKNNIIKKEYITIEVTQFEKIVISVGAGRDSKDTKLIQNIADTISLIAGQKAVVTKAKKSVAGFKIREGMNSGVKVTLRANRMYNFLEKFIAIASPRIKDFRGFSRNGFDGRGNYNFGLDEQLIFPEVNYDDIIKVHGMNITIVTTTNSDKEAMALLEAFGFPFTKKAA
jgi:large subunit ribosomal protein L5